MIALHLSTRFPRSKRLLCGAQFQRVLREATRSSDRLFTVAGCRTGQDDRRQGKSRLGLAISRKVLRRAVDRNRIKRIVREAFRQTPWPCQVDLVVIGRAGLSSMSNLEVRQSIEMHIRTIGQKLCGGQRCA